MRTNRLKWEARPELACRGFVLTDLVALATMATLLVATFLPLRGVRGRSQQEVCLANLKQIGGAMAMYFQDNGEWFPFEKRAMPDGVSPWLHGFYYGGHPGRHVPQSGSPSYWWGYTDTRYRDTPGGRPFNQYIYPGLPKWDVPEGDPLFDKVRDVPVFYCPADTGGSWHLRGADGGRAGGRDVEDTLYWATGTSYDENYPLAVNWAIGKFGVFEQRKWLNRSNAFLRVQLRRDAARFIVVYEDPFDTSQWNYVPHTGWHGELNRHNLLFLDGHAANIYTDTTNGRTRGLGWKSCSGNSPTDAHAWWNNPDDPDFRYRLIDPVP